MYSEPRIHKRIFGFGDDECGEDIKWEPSEFVIFETNNPTSGVNIYDIHGTIKEGDYSYFNYQGLIGDNINNQRWAGARYYNTIDFDSYYKFQGGIDNLFTGQYKVIDTKYRIIARILCTILWVIFMLYIFYINKNTIFNLNYPLKTNIYNYSIFSGKILFILLLWIAGAYISWDLFIISPISNYDMNRPPVNISIFDETNDNIDNPT